MNILIVQCTLNCYYVSKYYTIILTKLHMYLCTYSFNATLEGYVINIQQNIYRYIEI